MTEAKSNVYEIVVGLDFSDLSRRALEQALDIARTKGATELHVVTVAEPQGMLVRLPGSSVAVGESEAQETARSHVADIVRDYQGVNGQLNIERIAVYVVAGEPSKIICDLARAVDASLIVVATHGRRGVSRFVLGSVAANVVREAPCGVFVVRPTDFVGGEKVPEIQPPLAPGEPHLKHFAHRRTYHYVDKVSHWSDRAMPAS